MSTKRKIDDEDDDGKASQQGNAKRAKTETVQSLLDELQEAKTQYSAVAQKLANCQEAREQFEGDLQQCAEKLKQVEPYSDLFFDVMPWVPAVASTTDKIQQLLLGKEAKNSNLQANAEAVLA